MPEKPSELKPCPFCGAGTTEVQEHAIWQGTKYAEPISVSVVHWCDPVEGQPSRMLQKVGRDRASAIAAWNRRTPDRAALAAAVQEKEKAVAEEREAIAAAIDKMAALAAIHYDETSQRAAAVLEDAAVEIRARAGRNDG